MFRPSRVLLIPAVAALLALSSGCVERILKINTAPEGARVFLNDEEVGLSPVKTSFLWYGDYDIVIRKPGYQTLRTNYRIQPPWYQYPPIDLVAEAFIPGMIRDEHELPAYTLEPETAEPAEDLVNRAIDLREQTAP